MVRSNVFKSQKGRVICYQIVKIVRSNVYQKVKMVRSNVFRKSKWSGFSKVNMVGSDVYLKSKWLEKIFT